MATIVKFWPFLANNGRDIDNLRLTYFLSDSIHSLYFEFEFISNHYILNPCSKRLELSQIYSRLYGKPPGITNGHILLHLYAILLQFNRQAYFVVLFQLMWLKLNTSKKRIL